MIQKIDTLQSCGNTILNRPPLNKIKLIIQDHMAAIAARRSASNLEIILKRKLPKIRPILLYSISLMRHWKKNHETRIKTQKNMTRNKKYYIAVAISTPTTPQQARKNAPIKLSGFGALLASKEKNSLFNLCD